MCWLRGADLTGKEGAREPGNGEAGTFIREAKASRSLRPTKNRAFQQAVKSCPFTPTKGSRGFAFDFDCLAVCALSKIIAWKSTDPTGRRRLGLALPGLRPLLHPNDEDLSLGPRLRGLHPGLFPALPPGAKGDDTSPDFRLLSWAKAHECSG